MLEMRHDRRPLTVTSAHHRLRSPSYPAHSGNSCRMGWSENCGEWPLGDSLFTTRVLVCAMGLKHMSQYLGTLIHLTIQYIRTYYMHEYSSTQAMATTCALPSEWTFICHMRLVKRHTGTCWLRGEGIQGMTEPS